MPNAFFQAAYCQPPKVLGRQLTPLSLSHVFLLSELGNGFVVANDGTRSELFTAALVCSRTHRENARALFGSRINTLSMILWAARWPNRKIDAEREAFRTYLSDYCKVPEHWDDGEGKPFRAPWQFHFVLTLTRYFNCSIDDAWNMPVSLARCYRDAWAESEGDKSLVTYDEDAKIKWLNEQDEVNQ